MKRPIRFALRFFGVVLAIALVSSALVPKPTAMNPYTSAMATSAFADMTPVVCTHAKCQQQGVPSTCVSAPNKSCHNISTACDTTSC